MRIFTSEYKCGHKATTTNQELKGCAWWRIEAWEKKISKCMCPDCLAAQDEAKKREAKEDGLPDLKGTKKQVSWALSIRKEVIKNIDKSVELIKERFGQYSAEYIDAISVADGMEKEEMAENWINIRNVDFYEYLAKKEFLG